MSDSIKIAVGIPRLMSYPRKISQAKLAMMIVSNFASGLPYLTKRAWRIEEDPYFHDLSSE